ncbi:LacI family DNA-binding transcriptional regulator [Phycicoccus flavus]|uniref:LacI family transcriptional regulator n=1 Tax=Phycicoccus flavus TaxID=2502783 RepID=A0A8T6QXU5_9MICO|nr:LacI family DNA-binding transcriptional regulator [Phycicoccus flavus]NHA66468.1 LacI family transcriptional regulator [Phycicoccus flavus]
MDGPGRVRMADVARAAGVSVPTVSKVVGGRDGVAPATLARVQAAIDELGYQASLGAQGLRGRRSNAVGVLLAEFTSFTNELLMGVSDALGETGYELLAYSGGANGGAVGWERRSLSRIGGTLVDAAILVTPTVVSTDTQIPVVVVDPHFGPTDIPTVEGDNVAGAVAATEHLLGLGHRRIAHLAGREDLESSRRREQGFRTAMAGAGLAVDPASVRVGGYRRETSTAPALELLDRPDRPTAVFAANDESAVAVLEVAHRLGLRVPEDLSVVGFDNLPESALADPPLTTVAQPLREMGSAALTMVVDLLRGEEPPTRRLTLPTRLVHRSSTAPPARTAH